MASALESIIECPVCIERYRDPRALPCDHSLCKECADFVRKGSDIKCPVCREVYNFSQLRVDFKLAQVVDAVKEQGIKPRPAHKKGKTPKCEVCYKDEISFWCEDCQQWLCDGCREAHTRIHACKKHNVTSLALKNKAAKGNIDRESQAIKDQIESYSKFIKDIKDKVELLQTKQNKSLQELDALRNQALQEVKAYFDSLDSRILEFIQRNIDTLEKEKHELETAYASISSQWEALDKTVKEQSNTLAIEGNAILADIKDIMQTCTSPNVTIEDVAITLQAGPEWDAAKAALLELKDGRIQNKAFTSPNAVDLMTMTHKSFAKYKEVKLQNEPEAIRLIRHQLWSCQKNGHIDVFNLDLTLNKTISNAHWGDVCDVAELSDNTLVLACRNGLFHVDSSGSQLSKISNDKHNSVIRHKHCLYTYAYNPTIKVSIYKYSDSFVLVHTCVLPSPKNSFESLGVSNNCILICNQQGKRLQKMSLTGNLLDIIESKFSSVYICQTDNNDTVLMAGQADNKLCILDNTGKFHDVVINSKLSSPRSAQFIGDKLFVVCYSTCILTMYSSG